MRKREFERIFKVGFNKKNINYTNAQNGESDIRCFKCGRQAGLKKVSGRYKVVCTRRHKYNLITYLLKFTEMVNDLLECGSNRKCDLKSQA